MPGRHDGELGPTQLAWLDRELGRDPEVPAIPAMHHHPVPSGIAFMDTIMLSDADDLAAALRGHPPLTRILLHHLQGATAVAHLVPVAHSGPPLA